MWRFLSVVEMLSDEVSDWPSERTTVKRDRIANRQSDLEVDAQRGDTQKILCESAAVGPDTAVKCCPAPRRSESLISPSETAGSTERRNALRYFGVDPA
jgi:hypothetical protein